MEYIVDISKPPIRPPCRTIYEGFFSYGETKESIQQRKDWNEYIKKYGEMINTRNYILSVIK